MKAFKSKLKSIVTQKYGDLTHEEIAKRSGLRRPSITNWMGGRLIRRLDMDFLEPLAEWLECEVVDLYEVVEVEEDTGELVPA